MAVSQRFGVVAVIVGCLVAGCTSGTGAGGEDSAIGLTAAETTHPSASSVAPNSKEALESAAHQLDLFASEGNAEAAYGFYSQRCKNIIGSIDSYKSFLNVWRYGRNPRYTGVTSRVNGSSAQVVSIDEDPSAPADAMNPRTWTFIDGRWQFDNC
ncbi:MAG: hypothetical protein QM673_08470 [Gordonia sp. (in: high G+C Gram-positive bacteria)]